MCMLDMPEADYRFEEFEAARYEAALASLVEYHSSQNGWSTINDLIVAGLLKLDDLVKDELINGEF